MKNRFSVLVLVLLAAFLMIVPFQAFAGGAQESESGGEKVDEQAMAEPEYKIGIVFDVGGKGDKSFNDSAYRGLKKIAEEYNGYIADDPDNINYGNNIELKYLEPKSGGQDREVLLRVLAQEGYDLVIGVGFAFTDSLGKVAQEFENVHFGIVDGYIPDLTEDSNVTCLGFAEHQGSFLVGAIAALAADGKPLGYIGGMDIPLIHRFHSGFFAGAMYADQRYVEDRDLLMAQYIGKDPSAFADPKSGENIAANFYNQGAEIIYHAAGASGNGLFKAAKDMEKWAIGVDSDQGLVYASSDTKEEQETSKWILTSMLKRVDNSVYLTAQELIETGEVKGGYKTFDLEDNGVGYAVNDYNRELLAPYADQVEAMKQDIIDGKISVPDHDDKLDAWISETF
ncbi:MAG: BMP family ABC transporter substrate-binding protein [Spirochaetales bacterium]|nr:BMP family ABC transporter substrate-binding protein [Spirochaetales bacterium]